MEKTRKLGQMENVLADRSAINNLIVTTILRTKDKLLDVNILKEAVFKTVKSQPNLNSVLRRCEKNNELYFTPLKEIHDYFEELSKDTDWKEVCIEYNNKHLRDDLETSPPIKVLFIQSSPKQAILIVVGSHYATDGMTASTTISLILDTYSELQRNPAHSPIQQKAPRSLEDYIDQFVVSGQEFAKMNADFLKYHLNVMDTAKCGMDFVNTSSTKEIFSYYSTTESQFIQFKKICKSRNFTLGAALCGAYAFAMTRCIFSKNKNAADLPETINLIFELPVNLRDRVVTDKELSWKCVNYMASNPYISISVSRNSSFWEVVKNAKDAFDRLLSEDTKFYMFSSDAITEDDLSTEDGKRRIDYAKLKMNGLLRHGCFSNMKTYGDFSENSFLFSFFLKVVFFLSDKLTTSCEANV